MNKSEDFIEYEFIRKTKEKEVVNGERFFIVEYTVVVDGVKVEGSAGFIEKQFKEAQFKNEFQEAQKSIFGTDITNGTLKVVSVQEVSKSDYEVYRGEEFLR